VPDDSFSGLNALLETKVGAKIRDVLNAVALIRGFLRVRKGGCDVMFHELFFGGQESASHDSQKLKDCA